MITAEPRLLFVYGTLMSTASSAMGRGPRARLAKASSLIGRAAAPGYLFDLGDYPGLVLGPPAPARNAAGRVFGELRQLLRPIQMFDWLDRYEGIGTDIDTGINTGATQTAKYRRMVLDVTHLDADGREIASPAWIYVYEGPLAGARLLTAGVWPN